MVYLLRCRDGSLYTGITNDLERRLARHETGKESAYTRSRRPLTLAYRESLPDRSAALRREARAVQRRDVTLAIAAVLIAVVCVGLGIWQVKRLGQRRARNAVVAARW